MSLYDGSRAGVRACVRPSVRALTLSNMNISATSRPIATKFYVKHHWGGGKAVHIRFFARSNWNSGFHGNG